MYIDPFWAGVLATIGAELIACVVYGLVLEARKGKKNKDE